MGDREAEEKYADLDAAARKVCPEDDASRQRYSGNVADVIRATDEALERAAGIEQRLTAIAAAHPTARTRALTSVRTGDLYHCIWNSLRVTVPAFFTPKQQVLIAKLSLIVWQLNTAGQGSKAIQVQQQIDDTRDQVRAKWDETRRKYLAQLGQKMVRGYATGDVLARHFALEGFVFDRARWRLAVIATVLGDDAIEELVDDVIDPTDATPDVGKRAHLAYAPSVFSVLP